MYFCVVLTIQNTENFRIEQPCILTIGTFDGVHLGHHRILDRLNELKQQTGLNTVVLTFGPHPRKVLFPKDDLKLITSVEEKLELLDRCGVDVTVVYPFTKEFSLLDTDHYIEEMLLRRLNVKHLVIGYDHRFGRDRRGDISTLREASEHFGFTIEEIPARDIDQIVISSSKIRKALEEGNVELAESLLGHPFFLNGQVVKGKQLGRTLGYPTANLTVSEKDKIIPATGVYFVEAVLEGQSHYGMMSVGYNPTTDNDQKIKLEVHIFGFNSDIYYRFLKINFLKRLRDEKKFSGLQELKDALVSDEETCRRLITKMNAK
jgi:riboflavin kinase / FMN adenylyltransferase